jgi:hypothetical protein
MIFQKLLNISRRPLGAFGIYRIDPDHTVSSVDIFNGMFAEIRPGKPARAASHVSATVKGADFGIGARDNLKELGTLTTPDVEIQIDVEADEQR